MQNTEIETNTGARAEESEGSHSRAHGGNIYEAARRYGLDERKIIDFSSSINPLGPSSMALRAAKRSLSKVGRYPDPEMRDLRRAIARYFGIKSEQVMCGTGSNGLIHLLPRVFRPARVLIPAPSFSEYTSAVLDAGGEVVRFPLHERDGFRVDPVEMSFALKGKDMAFLCNPNNPTGQVIPKVDMLEIARFALEQEVRLVVDEAFMDFVDSESIIKEAVQTSHIICLRAFTKFFGMPGLRIGYAIAGEAVIHALREVQEPWTVSIPAEQAAIEALGDWSYIKKTRRLIEKERDRLLTALRIMPGVETFPSAANYIFVKITTYDVQMLVDRLGERGLLVRDCSTFPGLDNRYIRVAVRTRSENKRLIKTLRELLIG